MWASAPWPVVHACTWVRVFVRVDARARVRLINARAPRARVVMAVQGWVRGWVGGWWSWCWRLHEEFLVSQQALRERARDGDAGCIRSVDMVRLELHSANNCY